MSLLSFLELSFELPLKLRVAVLPGGVLVSKDVLHPLQQLLHIH